jgi:hypothetical protein
MFMKLLLVGLIGIAYSLPCNAALPPVYQNALDLEVMVQFLQQHPVVLESLRMIDLQNKLIHFGKDCVARFDHVWPKSADRTPPGPWPPLQFLDANCPIGPEKKFPLK